MTPRPGSSSQTRKGAGGVGSSMDPAKQPSPRLALGPLPILCLLPCDFIPLLCHQFTAWTGHVLPSSNLYFPICVLGPWEQAVPRSPSLWLEHSPFSCQVSLPPTPAPCPPPVSLFLLPTRMLSPANPHAALPSRVCGMLSDIAPIHPKFLQAGRPSCSSP